MKKEKMLELDYPILKQQWKTVNIVVGIIGLVLFGHMVLQKIGLVPSTVCMVHDVLHIYCPGCGGTRSLFAMLKGKVLESLYYNPACVLGFVLALYYEVAVILTLVKKNGKRYYSTSLLPVIVYCLIILIYTIVRNYLLIAHQYDMLQDFLPTS